MCQILVTTGALIGRPNGRNIRLLEKLVPQLNCDGLEFMLYSDWYDREKEITDYLISLNVAIPTMHCQKTVGELITQCEDDKALKNFEINARIASRIGARKLVMHLWNGEISDSNYGHNLDMYPYLREISDKYGVDLLIENVLCNVKDPLSRWEELIERYPDAHLIFDTKMADFHGQLDALYEDKNSYLWKNHIKHYHVNDYGGSYMDWSNLKVLPIGAGHIDFDRFFEFIKSTGYNDTFTVEATAFNKDGVVDTDMLNECFDRIRDYVV